MSIVADADGARRLVERLQNAQVVSFDTEFSGARIPVKKGQKKGNVVDALRCRLTGLSLAFDGGAEAAYVPIGHRVGDNLPAEEVDRILACLVDRPVLWAHGLKAELLSLWRRDRATNRFFADRFAERLGKGLRDGAVASWLLDSGREGGHSLKKVRQTMLGLPPRPGYEEVFGQTAVEDLPPEHAAQYAELDAIDELELGEQAWHHMDEKQRWAMDHLEMPLAAELVRMAKRGVPCDRTYLERLRESLAPRQAELEHEFLWWTGCRLSSRHELTTWLPGRWPKSAIIWNEDGTCSNGAGAVKAALAACEPGSDGHRAATMMQEYGDLSKLRGTYCDGYLRCLDASEDGRLHPQLGVIGADGSAPRTGRFACSAPNLQNIPRPDDELADEEEEEGQLGADHARTVRRAFRPEEGWELTEADYKQVELCQLGHLLDGKGTHAEAARSGKDQHQAVADVFSTTRYEGKHLNFAVIFQCGPDTLAKRSGKTVEEARKLLNQMKQALPEVMALQDRCAQVAQERGYIRTMSGRRRSVPELQADRSTKEGNKRWYRGKRVAFNTPIQGGARDIVARAMPMVTEALRTAGLKARVVMQVHDSLWFEHPADEREAVHEVARRVMPQAWPGLKVPLAVDVKSGKSLGDC